MHDEEMLTWLLFYTSLLDVTKTPAQDVLDPGGIVQSQVVADRRRRPAASCSTRSQSQRTLASRFLDDFFGSGVQHIALATDDIFATVARLSANGVDAAADPGELLRRPRGPDATLRPRTIARLRENQILYDREGAAEYLPALHAHLRGRLLLRDRRAARLCRLRRGQRADPPCRPDAARAQPGDAAGVNDRKRACRSPIAYPR